MNRKLRRFCQSGFSLLEVLVTLVIIAVGMMGFAAMMLNSMKNNRTAMQRSLATLYAYDIIDCMRVNRQVATSGSYTRDFTDSVPSAGGTVANNDLYLWLDALSKALPSGQGKISFTGNTAKVEIKWTETLNSGDNATHTWKTVSTL